MTHANAPTDLQPYAQHDRVTVRLLEAPSWNSALPPPSHDGGSYSYSSESTGCTRCDRHPSFTVPRDVKRAGDAPDRIFPGVLPLDLREVPTC